TRDPRGSRRTTAYEPGHTVSTEGSVEGAHAVEFSKTVAPLQEGASFPQARPGAGVRPRSGPTSIAPKPGRGTESGSSLSTGGVPLSSRRPSRHDLHRHGTAPRAVVEVEPHDLLPGSKREATIDQWNRLRRPNQGGAQVGMGVRVVVEAVVL